MRIVVLSSTEFGRICIEKGIVGTPGVSLAGILTTPKEISISYSDRPVSISTHASFKEIAHLAGCEVITLGGSITVASYMQCLKAMNPDLLCALGWYYMVPGRVRESVAKGCIGIHASLLPKYRGGAPIPWAIINGERETGVSLFYLEDGVDTGDIIGQSAFPIDKHDTCATVYAKATEAAVRLLRSFLPALASGSALRIPQDETQATCFPQRAPEDGRIDWSKGAEEIKDFIRAQTRPYPGAFTFIGNKKLVIWDAEIEEARSDSSHT